MLHHPQTLTYLEVKVKDLEVLVKVFKKLYFGGKVSNKLCYMNYYYYYYYYYYWWGGTLINGHILVNVWAHSTSPDYCEIMNDLGSFSFTILWSNLYHSLGKFSWLQIGNLLFFPENIKGLTWQRQFAWNVKPCFLGIPGVNKLLVLSWGFLFSEKKKETILPRYILHYIVLRGLDTFGWFPTVFTWEILLWLALWLSALWKGIYSKRKEFASRRKQILSF